MSITKRSNVARGEEEMLREKMLVPVEEVQQATKKIEMAMGIEPASLGSPRPDLAGLRLMHLTGDPIYLVNPEGLLQWIPNGATYNLLFRDWDGIYRVDIQSMAVGPALSDGAVLVKGHISSAVYLASNGRKRWITSPAAMDKYHFDWDRIYVVPQVLVNALPTGSNWS